MGLAVKRFPSCSSARYHVSGRNVAGHLSAVDARKLYIEILGLIRAELSLGVYSSSVESSECERSACLEIVHGPDTPANLEEWGDIGRPDNTHQHFFTSPPMISRLLAVLPAESAGVPGQQPKPIMHNDLLFLRRVDGAPNLSRVEKPA